MTQKAKVNKMFESIANHLNKSTDGGIGSWELDYAPCYGGWVINEIVNESGGVMSPFGTPRMKTNAFLDFLFALRTGCDTNTIKAVQ